MEFSIRAAGPGDAAALAACAAVTFPLACPPGSDRRDIDHFLATELSVNRFKDYLSDPDRILLCLGAGESAGGSHADSDADTGPDPRVEGYSMLVRTQPADPQVRSALTLLPAIELSKFYVDPAHHGTGAAGALMAASLAAAAGSGMRGIWLGVNQENERAIRFYSRSGFRLAGTKTFRLGGRIENDYVFEQPLASRAA